MSELQRVLAALDDFWLPSGHRYPLAEDAARLLRELAADFDGYADHAEGCDSMRTLMPIDCDCGLDAAIAKWRLE